MYASKAAADRRKRTQAPQMAATANLGFEGFGGG